MPKVLILNEPPPNDEQIREAIPDIDKFPGAVFAYYPYIYNPSGGEIPDSFVVHEQVHLDRQARIGVDRWWEQYLRSANFRLNEEILAYRAQYASTTRLSRPLRRQLLTKIAKDLSGALYSNLINYDEARELIRSA